MKTRSEDRRVLTVHAATRRAARRLVVERPGQTILVAAICAIAIASGILAHAHVVRARATLEEHATLRHGVVAVSSPARTDPSPGTTSAAGSGTATVTLASAPGLARGVIDASAASAAERAIAELGGRPFRRIELAAHAPDGTIRAMVAVEPDDPGRRLVASSGPNGGLRIAARAGGREAASPVEWVTVPADAVYGFDRDGVAWVNLRRLLEALPAGEGGASRTPSLVVAGEIPAGVTAFAFVYELSQRLANDDLALDALAWPEIVGYGRYVGAGSTAALIGPLALAVAAVAIAGSVAVAVRDRMRDTVLLRTLGFEVGVIRGLHVREISAASVGAAALVLLVVAVASRLGAPVAIDATVRRILLGGAALPPVVAFLTARRQLRSPLADLRREADL